MTSYSALARNSVLAMVLSWSGASVAEELRIVSWGGAYSDAQRAAFFEPFMKATGITIIEDVYSGEFGKIRAQAETGNIQWDIVEDQWAPMQQGCLEGLFEPIDVARLQVDGMPDGTITECFVSVTYGSAVLAYNPAKFSQPINTWADFWDVERFPGKRGMRQAPNETLEIAALAAGVAPEDVYDVLGTTEGQDRVFAKLAELRPHIVWWTSGTEQVQGLLAGDFDMTMAWNGRIATVNEEENAGLKISWEAGHVLNGDYWAILRGSPNVEQAMRFFEFALQPEPQAEMMRQIPYGQVNTLAYDLISAEDRAVLPTSEENVPYAVWVDPDFWLEHHEALQERFNNWVNQ